MALTHEAATVRLAGLLQDHSTHMEPGELIWSVEPWTVLAQPLNPEGVLLAGAWHAQTGRGNGYRGVSVAAVDGDVGSGGFSTRLKIASVSLRGEVGNETERFLVDPRSELGFLGGRAGQERPL